MNTGYQILCEEQSRDHASSSFPDVTKGLWKGIWKLRVPGKIKHFLWRACSDYFPTKHNLWKRRIVPNDVCEICNSHPETVLHSLWNCEASSAVWNGILVGLTEGKLAEVILLISGICLAIPQARE